MHGVEGLGGHTRSIAGTSDPLTNGLLTAAATVRVGSIEAPNTQRPSSVHERQRLVEPFALAKERRCAADTAKVATAENEPIDRR